VLSIAQLILFARSLEEKAIANATILADVGSTYEKGHNL
jgi:hypothetical protein